ncbi:hypothetical protein [Acinetobacter stercoris]|uniref:Uncharacterized protein n=1 Tax=Acinetobacter stercoris TaxID=2126983 RepID=A0A2U3MTW4_9GAMM|nr:hypothetical protein [Acinetobacter stercoris]SPL68866.1 hypothetical protein KPC_0044 [Acinetobacter stercoris]
MNKQLCIILSVLSLSACGDGSNDSSTVTSPNAALVANTTTLYGYDGNYDLNFNLNVKTYHIDENKNLTIQYAIEPDFATEALRSFLTQDGISTTLLPKQKNNTYLIGENALFNDGKLEYTVSNAVSDHPLTLSYQYKKIDVSGLDILKDSNNPLHKLKSTIEGQIVVALFDLSYTSLQFPEGSICWQKQSVINSQEFIEFYTNVDNFSKPENSEIEASGSWSNINWVKFKNSENGLSDTANVKLNVNGQEYWGYYHPQNELFNENQDGFSCDLMNKTAFDAVNQPFEKLNTAQQK